MVVLDGGHLSHRVEVVASLVRELVLRDVEPWGMDGGLPPDVERALSGRQSRAWSAGVGACRAGSPGVNLRHP
ncbi:hypothetical protein [Actinokineospora spheciospongiae]|uniref:hypothetical protein n=1 Tax=Actinokineospora spheciospongiae TaxID=909613 RepID=UPI0012682B6F|nr:hypothetical protein [Actinokineospora spheciospongiae]